MTEQFLRIAYFAIGIYSFANAMLTSTFAGRAAQLSAVEKLGLGSIWLSFFAVVVIVAWSSRLAAKQPGTKLTEGVFRASFLTAGLFFASCALATTMAMTAPGTLLQDWFCVGGLWVSFLLFCAIVAGSGRFPEVKPASVAVELDAAA